MCSYWDTELGNYAAEFLEGSTSCCGFRRNFLFVCFLIYKMPDSILEMQPTFWFIISCYCLDVVRFLKSAQYPNDLVPMPIRCFKDDIYIVILIIHLGSLEQRMEVLVSDGHNNGLNKDRPTQRAYELLLKKYLRRVSSVRVIKFQRS